MAPEARVWLERTKTARILHVFDRLCNLVSESDGVVSLVTPPVGMGPFSLLLPSIDFPRWIGPETHVMCFHDGLQLGELNVEASPARLWNPQPRWAAIRNGREGIREAVKNVAEALQENAPLESLVGLLFDRPRSHSCADDDMLRKARIPARNLTRGILTADFNLCVEGTFGLAGLGVGLTPAGDDWIVGSLIAGQIIMPLHKILQASSVIAETANARTSTFSSAWIKAAGRGECHEDWHRLLHCMVNGDPRKMTEATSMIVCQGHTSGSDALAGFLAVMMEA